MFETYLFNTHKDMLTPILVQLINVYPLNSFSHSDSFTRKLQIYLLTLILILKLKSHYSQSMNHLYLYQTYGYITNTVSVVYSGSVWMIILL